MHLKFIFTVKLVDPPTARKCHPIYIFSNYNSLLFIFHDSSYAFIRYRTHARNIVNNGPHNGMHAVYVRWRARLLFTFFNSNILNIEFGTLSIKLRISKLSSARAYSTCSRFAHSKSYRPSRKRHQHNRKKNEQVELIKLSKALHWTSINYLGNNNNNKMNTLCIVHNSQLFIRLPHARKIRIRG